MTGFSFVCDKLELPPGAWAPVQRRWLKYNGKPVLAITDGEYRNYVYPLFSPAGYLVTSEAPADHPHHNSLWIGSDKVHALMPTGDDEAEEYTYCFYVNEVFQGRAPGRIIETTSDAKQVSENQFVINQQLDWCGPVEWGARDGRIIAKEHRKLSVTISDYANIISVDSELEAACGELVLGPTRHAYFNVRVAESMTVANGGLIQHQPDLATAGDKLIDSAKWVDFSGPVGGGAKAGITVIPQAIEGQTFNWFVSDWGVISVGPYKNLQTRLRKGERFSSRYVVHAHDGEPEIARLNTGGECSEQATED